MNQSVQESVNPVSKANLIKHNEVLSIQYLRGLAAILVLLEHVSQKSTQYSSDVLANWHIGGAGVDLFFLISGFMCHTSGDMVLGKLGLSNILGGYFFVTVLLLGSLITGYLLFHMVEKPLTKIFCKRTPRPIPSVLTKNA